MAHNRQSEQLEFSLRPGRHRVIEDQYAAISPDMVGGQQRRLMRQVVETWYTQQLEAWADWVEMSDVLRSAEEEGGP